MSADPCPFCSPPPERIVGRTARALAIRDAYPVSAGHTLLVPRRHVGSLFDLTMVEWVELGQLLVELRATLAAERRPDGFNIGVNEGAAAGQTVPHLHLHLIPRYLGDQPDPRGGVRWIFPDKARYWPDARAAATPPTAGPPGPNAPERAARMRRRPRSNPESRPHARLVKPPANSDTIGMIETTYLTNQFLIAMPALADPNFFQTVTYISEHNAGGALGLIINRPLDLSLGQLLEHLQIDTDRPDLAALPVYQGGPVQPEQGFVIHMPVGQWGATLHVTEQIGITTSRDILQAVARGEGPERLLVTLGYAGWGPGQLERELAENAWLSTPADFDILFYRPSEQRWTAAAALLGVDLNLLSSDAGHA